MNWNQANCLFFVSVKANHKKNIQQHNQVNIKMDTIFMNSENSKTSKSYVLTLKLISKLDLRIGEKVIALSNLSNYYTWRNIKSS